MLSSTENHQSQQKIPIHKTVTYVAVVVLYFAIAIWKFSPVLSSDNHAMAVHGDGAGIHGVIFTTYDAFKKQGLSFFFGDTIKADAVGFGLPEATSMTSFWKLSFVTVAHFVEIINVYDAIVFLGFFFMCLAGFLFLRVMRVQYFVAFLGGLTMASFDNFYVRSTGHLSLAVYFPVMLSLAAVVWASRKPTINRLCVLAASIILTAQVAEYYGYFTLIFCTPLFILYVIINFSSHDVTWKKFLFGFLCASTLFSILICLSFPKVIFGVIGSKLFQSDEVEVLSNMSHPMTEFIMYSVHNPWAIVAPKINWVKSLLSNIDFVNSAREFTHRIGFVMPFFSVVYSLVCAGIYFATRKKEFKPAFVISLLWMPSIILALLFSLHPTNFALSLVPLTHKFFPMFRASTRALLLVDLGIAALFFYHVTHMLRFALKNAQWKKMKCVVPNVLLLAGALLFLSAGVSDAVTWGRLASQSPGLPVNVHPIYTALKEQPDGVAAEIPFYSPIEPHPDMYEYLFNQHAHQKPIANMVLWGPSRAEYGLDWHFITKRWNSLTPDAIEEMNKVGVRWLVVDAKKAKNHEQLKRNENVRILPEVHGKYLVEILPDANSGVLDFRKDLIDSLPRFTFLKGFAPQENSEDSIYWRWGERESSLSIKNPTEGTLFLRFNFTLFQPKGTVMRIKTDEIDTVGRMPEDYTSLAIQFSAPPGSSTTVDFISQAPTYMTAAINNRPVVFCLYEYTLEILPAPEKDDAPQSDG